MKTRSSIKVFTSMKISNESDSFNVKSKLSSISIKILCSIIKSSFFSKDTIEFVICCLSFTITLFAKTLFEWVAFGVSLNRMIKIE